MYEWTINPGTAFSLTLAADARLSKTDYVNDQIWEFVINRGDPPAVSLDTTYGLRARKQRIFPKFKEADQQIISPDDLLSSITIQEYYPNYVKANFVPLDNLRTSLEYWIPDSHTAASRITLQNTIKEVRQITLAWNALLSPGQEGNRMAIREIENVTVLQGRSGELAPVLFIGGGAYESSGPFPAIELVIDLEANQTQSAICVLASLNESGKSFEHARNIAAVQWNAEITKVGMANADRFQIITGEPTWDAAFELSQTIAASLLLSPTEYLPEVSFVQTRQPDQGYSIRGDGSDYNHLWNGQATLHAYFYCEEILPKNPEIASGFLLNFLATQNETGQVDGKPGLGNQRTSMNATPLLAQLAWSIYNKTQDDRFLERVYPSLKEFFDSWFTPEMDKDQDGLPEWRHPWQTGLEDHPTFSTWVPGSKGIDITTFESPDLTSWLFLEGKALLAIARILEDSTTTGDIKNRVDRLRGGLLSLWDADQKIFNYRDRDTHLSTETQVLYRGQNIAEEMVQKSYPEAVRLQFRFERQDEATRRFVVFIHGTGPSGGHRIERISSEQIHWHIAFGYATSERVYTNIERIIIEGILPDDTVTVSTTSHKDLNLTFFLPLLTQIPTLEMAEQMVQNHLKKDTLFWQNAGLPNYPNSQHQGVTHEQGDVNIFWNSIVIQSLMQYGQYSEAAEIMTKVMNTLATCLKKEGGFRRYYRPVSGEGKSEKNSLEGLAPLGSFLKLIGVRFINPWRVYVSGSNPFSWPVTVKYYDTTVLRHRSKTTVVFPDGQTLSIDDEKPHILALE